MIKSIYRFLKYFTNHRNKAHRVIVFCHRLLLNILKDRTAKEAFQQSRNKDSFKHIPKRSANMHELRFTVLQNHLQNIISARHLKGFNVHYDFLHYCGGYRNIAEFQICSRMEVRQGDN